MAHTQNTGQAQNTEETQDTGQTQDTDTETDYSDDNDQDPEAGGGDSEPADGVRSPLEAAREAREQLSMLTGMEAQAVSSLARTQDGWALTIEVLELERVPDTMSLLASYEVELDARGSLTGYRRVRRYERGRADRK